GFGAPVSIKVVSAGIPHKTDIGGVRLDVAPADGAVRAAYQAVTEAATAARPAGPAIDGVLVSPMRRGGTELLVGVVRDPQWGPGRRRHLGGRQLRSRPGLDPRAPVVVGVGQASGRLGTPGDQGRSPVDLAADAARAALADSGADPARIAAAIDTVAGVRQFE